MAPSALSDARTGKALVTAATKLLGSVVWQ
jgi:hypothetical protein